MDELIVRKLRGEATDIEIRQLDRWRAESPENERAYRGFVDLWNGTGEPEAPAVSPSPAVEAIVREGDARRARSQARAARQAGLRTSWAWARWGLTAAAAAALVVWMSWPHAQPGSSTHGLFPVESSSSPANITTLSLSDGSVVRMMPETRVEFPATVDRREVVLEGRAFFAVTADSIPFVVKTHVGEVIVHGTRFEVWANGDELRLAVVEGRVRLEGEPGSLDVGPLQVAYMRPGSPPKVVDQGDVWSLLDWPDGLLIFQSTPLSLVAEELGRHFGRKVSIVDDTLGRRRITAWFDDEPMGQVISAVCLVAAVRCEVGDEEITIGR